MVVFEVRECARLRKLKINLSSIYEFEVLKIIYNGQRVEISIFEKITNQARV